MQLLNSRVVAIALGALLIVGLGAGGAVARDLLGSRDIRDGAIAKVDIRRGAVGGNEVRDRSLHGPDLATNTLGRRQLREGSVGVLQLSDHVRSRLNQRARDGRDGADGSDGKDGVSGYEVVGRGTDAVTLAAGESATITSLCKSADQEVNDKVATAGGAQATAGTVTLGGSYPSGIEQVGESTEADPAGLWAARSWTVEATAGPDGATVQPFVICQDNAEDD